MRGVARSFHAARSRPASLVPLPNVPPDACRDSEVGSDRVSQAPRALLRKTTPAFRALDMSRSAASERLPRQQPRSRRPRRPGRSGAATEEPPHRRSLIQRDLGIAYRYKFPIRRRARTLAGRKPARQCAGLFHFFDSPRRSRSGRPLSELPDAGPPRAPAVHRLLAPSRAFGGHVGQSLRNLPSARVRFLGSNQLSVLTTSFPQWQISVDCFC